MFLQTFHARTEKLWPITGKGLRELPHRAIASTISLFEKQKESENKKLGIRILFVFLMSPAFELSSADNFIIATHKHDMDMLPNGITGFFLKH